MPTADSWSKTWTFFEDAWHEGNVRMWGPRTHAAWLCSVVFDGARAFEGVTPDLDLHCARVNESAKKLFLKPTVSTETWVKLAREGIAKFGQEVALYIRPMYWAEKEGPWVQAHDPESTRWCLSIYEAPMRPPKGFSITLSPYRRPTLETMPVDAKAGLSFTKPEVTPGEPLRLEIESFLDSVRTRREPRVTARQGRDALALALEIQASMAAHAVRAGLKDFFAPGA